ncbi:MAG: adenylyl-sulfate kinase [Acidobacteria bacterium]|nr:adenylyl-sulfate kinase [Acidobacteriota bacterium]
MAKRAVHREDEPLKNLAGETLSSRPLRIVIVGHVDHGKSTLVGRLFYDTGSLPEGKFEQIQAVCQKRGCAFEWAFLMDALQAERDQNITIETSQIWFKTRLRPYVIIDAPGHKEFLKNMVTGAAGAHAAFLLIAADEGVQEQSRRHGYLLSLLGVRQVSVLVNKMDLVGYSQETFDSIVRDYQVFLNELGVEPRSFIPISARNGDNVADHAEAVMPWYRGLNAIEALDSFELPAAKHDLPLRFPVQDIYRFDHRRIVAGRIESGTLRVGDRLVFSPDGKESVIKSIEVWNGPSRQTARAGESVGITLSEQIFIERGHIASHEQHPPQCSRHLQARLFWMGRRPLEIGRRVKVKLATQESECELASIERVVDSSTLELLGTERRQVARNEIAEVTLETRSPVAFDAYEQIPALGRFVIVDQYDLAGGGIILGNALQPRQALPGKLFVGRVSPDERARAHGHQGALLWISGGSKELKKQVVEALDRSLFSRNVQTIILDESTIDSSLHGSLPSQPAGDRLLFGLLLASGFAAAGLVVLAILEDGTHELREKCRKKIESLSGVFVHIHLKPEQPDSHSEFADVLVEPSKSVEDSVLQILERILPEIKYKSKKWFYEI